MNVHFKNIFDSLKLVINGDINLKDLTKIPDDEEFIKNLAIIFEDKFKFLSENELSIDKFKEIVKLRKEEYDYFISYEKLVNKLQKFAAIYNKSKCIFFYFYNIANFFLLSF